MLVLGGIGKIQKNLIDILIEKIDDFLDLKTEEIEKGNKIGDEIINKAKKLEKSIKREEKRSKFREILIDSSSRHSKLSKNVIKKKNGPLKSDWEQLAEQSMSKLKDEVLALKDFIHKNESVLRKRMIKNRYGIDLKELNQQLKEEENVDESLNAKLSNRIQTIDERELQSVMKNHKDRLKRIIRLLVYLKEVRRIEQ